MIMEEQKTAVKRLSLSGKRFLWILIIAAWLFVILQLLIGKLFEKNTSIVAAFAVTKPQEISATLEVTANYGDKLFDEREKERLLNELAEAIGLELGEDAEAEWITGEGREELVVKKEARAAKTELKAISLCYSEKDLAESTGMNTAMTKNYVYASIALSESLDAILAYKKLVEKTLSELACTEISTTIQLVGEYEGYLTLQERNEVTEKILKSLQAEVMYEYRQEEMYTVYAYTAGLDDYISVEDKKINLHIAMSKDEENYRTILYLASPILPDTW